MNHDRGGSACDRQFALGKPPREIDVVARGGEHRVESAGRLGRGLVDDHIASAHLLERVVAGANLARLSGRGGDRGRERRGGWRREIGTAGGRRVAAGEGFDQMVEPIAIGARVGVDEGDAASRGGLDPAVARGREAAMLRAQHAHARARRDLAGRVARAVIDDDSFVVGIVEMGERVEALAERRSAL